MDDILEQAAADTRSACDPVTLELVRGGLRSVQREMETLIERTAMSPFIREKKDFFAAIYDGMGRLVAGTAAPTSDGDTIPPLFEHYPLETMQDGDIYWYNDCYGSKGAVTHSPDQVFIMPVFGEGELVAFVMCWAHCNDIGGMRAGSLSSDCTEVFQEGIIVPPVRVASAGVVCEELLRLFFRNSRFPAMIQGDVRAILAAVRTGRRRIEELLSRFGASQLRSAFDLHIATTRELVKKEFAAHFAPGSYQFTETIQSDGHGNGPFKLRYQLHVHDGNVVLDTTATSDQSPGPINYIMSARAPQVALAQYFLRHDRQTLSNAGFYGTLDEVVLRPGSLVQPKFPAALGFRGITLMRNVSACLGLLNVATRGKANASHSTWVIYYVRGKDDEGKQFLMSDGIGVGYGARPDCDGNDAIYLVANENYPAEFVEAVYPLRVLRYAINPDTGGPGKWRGGCGVIREMEVLCDEAMVSMRIDGEGTPPWGTNGGQAARTGRCIINPGRPDERVIGGLSDGNIVKRGDVISVQTGGGGGWGHPYDRDPALVLADVVDGFVSVRSAHDDYGVLIAADGESIDVAQTRRLRSERPASELFHRLQYEAELI